MCRCTWRTPPAATTRWPGTSTPSRRLWDHIGDKRHRLLPGHLPRLGRRRGARSTPSSASRRITGRIDLVHCNDSRDAAGSGADRHANFGTGQIDPQLLVAVVKAADAPVICETADEGRKDDIAFLREHSSG